MSLFGKTHAADACCECAFGPHMIFPHVRKQTRRCYSHVSLRMSKYNRQNICNLLFKLTFLVKSILSCLFSQTINNKQQQKNQTTIITNFSISNCWIWLKLLHGFVKIDTWISLSCYMDCKNCCMDLSK